MENGKPEQKDELNAVMVGYDDPGDPKVMRISIPVDSFAKNEFGTVLMKGFMDDIKEMGLQIIRNKRKLAAEAASRIISPGAAKNPLNIIQ